MEPYKSKAVSPSFKCENAAKKTCEKSLNYLAKLVVCEAKWSNDRINA